MATLFVMQNVCGEDKFGQQKERWLQIAQENMPTLQKRVVEPLRVVEAVKDEKVFQGWTYHTGLWRASDRLLHHPFEDHRQDLGCSHTPEDDLWRSACRDEYTL